MNANERKGDEEFMTSYLRRGDVVVDVGANIGALVLTAAAIVGQTGLVYGIEAHPRIFGYLKKNVELNRRNNVRLLNFAAGQNRGAVRFSDENDDDINCVTDDSGITVQMETLDRLITNEARRIALLKIDVEGYEKFVIEGAAEVLARTDCIYFEAWEQHFVRNGYDTAAVLKILKGHGFTVHKKLGDADLLEVPVNYVAERCENLVAIRDVARYSRRMKSRASAVS
jgi:FkbM family methyltransferase